MHSSFPAEVRDKLQYYVYRLIDPRNGETFYVGKGKGDRVFQHVQATLAAEDGASDDGDDTTIMPAKLARIREIRRSGLEVAHIIQRHGLTEPQAHLVEAALIDVFPGLTNLQGGHGNAEYGVMHADEIIRKYKAEALEIRHRIVFFTVQPAFADERGEYEACRGVWKMSRARAEQAELAMPVVNGIVAGVFRPTRWLEATVGNFPAHISVDMPGRFGFEGEEADLDTIRMYLNKRLPDTLIGQRKSQNPVRYSYG